MVNPVFRGGTAWLAKDSNDAVRFAHHILLAAAADLSLLDTASSSPNFGKRLAGCSERKRPGQGKKRSASKRVCPELVDCIIIVKRQRDYWNLQSHP
jgi:hypothetical protein